MGVALKNRCKFPLQVMDILISEFGSDKVGIKVTPVGRLNDMYDSDPIKLYSYFFEELNKKKVNFIQLTRAPEFRHCLDLYDMPGEKQIPDVYKTFRDKFNGILIANNSFDFESATELIKSGLADMVTFGRKYIANPDLVLRFKNNWKLNAPNEKLFYTAGAEGYNDYLKYQEELNN